MIKINLLPVKKKKKAKPLPTFVIAGFGLFILTAAIMAYLFYFYNAKLLTRKNQVAENEKKILELKEKIRAVEDYEKRNADFKRRKEIIEQLGKNKTIPVKALDEISALLPAGVWVNSMDMRGTDINLSCTAFTNTDVVNYVNNLKNSHVFTDVYLQESIQAQISGFSSYGFKLTFKVKN
ncbi:MAG: PilN domain-containing protein [Nitrospirae bacterium]|nr:PilN domain-containing protein [Nitrospirota bacterium]